MISNSPSNDSKSSDNEFWNSFENPEPSQKPPKASKPKETFKYLSLRPSEKERYEKTIAIIRDSKEEEMRSLQIKVENQTKKQLLSSINELKQSFQKEAIRLQDTYAGSRSALQKKDHEILSLITTITDQAYIITKMRLSYENSKKTKKPSKLKSDSELNSNIKSLTLQIQVLKQVCEQYKQDVDNYKALNIKLLEENNELQNMYNKASNDLIFFTKEQQIKAKKEKDEIIAEFNKYKIETGKEVEVRELVNNRQMQIILSLQKELKDAKMIINTPRIRYKILERLKDMHEVNEDQELGQRMKKAKTDSMHKYPQGLKTKAPNNYSYKDYQNFSSDDSRKGLFALRAVSISPRLEKSNNRSSKLGYTNDSRQKFSKNSVLLNSADE
ncbi:hypothetical protein SteCoe_9557 [Stentor coeruleus]|uniref:DUF4709 domain-containing protein n=1 Tax=Stentor coeruleus TaxID=5963 RepID=A0A1R2CHT8_9CILI|nr:hypothetical protein SteCoe_9557 [Stentor coeruleus]